MAVSITDAKDRARAARSETRRRPGAGSLTLPFDPLLALSVLGICICSVITIAAATADDIEGSPRYFVDRQIAFFVVGAVLAVAVSRFDYSRLRELKWAFFGLLMASLFATMAFGSITRGSRLAIQLPFFSFQSSELGKVLIAIVLSAFLVDRIRRLHDRDTTARALLLALVPALVVMLQPDLGSALVYVVIVLAVLFTAGTPWRHFAVLGTLGLAAVVLSLTVLPKVGVEVLQDYQKERLTSFIHPSSSPGDEGYQQEQSRVAIGSGEKTGRGDRATQTKYDFLPEHHTDFVFAVVGERYGFVGAALVLSLYALFIWRALRIVTIAKNLFGALLAGAFVAMMLFQVFQNVGMNVGIMPITGITLPLMSYGGSSVISTFLVVGLLQSIYAQGRASAATKGRVLGY